MMQTVRSRCPICDGILESRPVKLSVQAMIVCPHCTQLCVVDTELLNLEPKIPEPQKIDPRIPSTDDELLTLITPKAKRMIIELHEANYKPYAIARHMSLGIRIVKCVTTKLPSQT